MDKGQVKWVGSPAHSSISSYIAPSLLEDFNISSNIQTLQKNVDAIEAQQNVLIESDSIHVSEEAQNVIEFEHRKEGRVEPVIYKWVIAWFHTVYFMV